MNTMVRLWTLSRERISDGPYTSPCNSKMSHRGASEHYLWNIFTIATKLESFLVRLNSCRFDFFFHFVNISGQLLKLPLLSQKLTFFNFRHFAKQHLCLMDIFFNLLKTYRYEGQFFAVRYESYDMMHSKKLTSHTVWDVLKIYDKNFYEFLPFQLVLVRPHALVSH